MVRFTLMPSAKWWAATVVAAGTIAIAEWTGDGVNTDDERILVIGIVVSRLVAWITPNA